MAVEPWIGAIVVAATIAVVVMATIVVVGAAIVSEEPFFAFSNGALQVVAQEHPLVVIIEVLVLASQAITIVIIVVVFVSSISVKAATGPKGAFDVSGAADVLYAASITEGPSEHRSRTQAAISIAAIIIEAGHRVIIAEVPVAFFGAIIEAATTIIGLEEDAASTFSAIIIVGALAVIPSRVVAIAFTNIAWVAVVFVELKVGQDQAGAGHSQALALTPRKDHPVHLRRRTHHHSHLLRRSSPLHHYTTVNRRQHLQLEGLVHQFGLA